LTACAARQPPEIKPAPNPDVAIEPTARRSQPRSAKSRARRHPRPPHRRRLLSRPPRCRLRPCRAR